MASGVAVDPSIAAAASPGRMRITTNTRMNAPNVVGTTWASWRRKVLVIRRKAGQVEAPERLELRHPLELRAVHHALRLHDQGDDRQVGHDLALDLQVQLLPLLRIELAAGRLQVLLEVVAADVDRAALWGQGIRQPDVRVRLAHAAVDREVDPLVLDAPPDERRLVQLLL